LFDLTGKTAVVTGGGSGFGEAAAYALAIAGAEVVIGDVGLERAEKVAESLSGHGYRCEARYLDVADSKSVDDLMAFTADHFGKIDILFSNAGILMDQRIEQITDNDWRKLMSINLDGAFYCCRSVLEYMKKNHYGKIVITSSNGGKMSHPTASVSYIASKGALLSFTRHLANQVGQFGITVNAVAPGTSLTPLVAHRGEETLKAIAKKIPMLRLGRAEEIAGAVVYLASDCSNFVTGEIIDINGGLYID